MKPRQSAGEFSLEKDGRVGGFTLVELLVTISIISVLAGMLLPALGRAEGQAKTAQCLSNARQLGMAVMLYVGDHRETYPMRTRGMRLGRPLVSERDLVKELAHLPPAALKPMLARHRGRMMLASRSSALQCEHRTEAILASNAAGLHWRVRAE